MLWQHEHGILCQQCAGRILARGCSLQGAGPVWGDQVPALIEEGRPSRYMRCVVCHLNPTYADVRQAEANGAQWHHDQQVAAEQQLRAATIYAISCTSDERKLLDALEADCHARGEHWDYILALGQSTYERL